MVDYKRSIIPDRASIIKLYDDVGWTAYTKDEERLYRAINNSLDLLTAWDNNNLVGLLRTVGDSETIIYIQDILVLREYQGNRIGKKLINKIMQEYQDVRQKVLLTDSTEKTESFYQKVGFEPVEEYDMKAFIKID